MIETFKKFSIKTRYGIKIRVKVNKESKIKTNFLIFKILLIKLIKVKKKENTKIVIIAWNNKIKIK